MISQHIVHYSKVIYSVFYYLFLILKALLLPSLRLLWGLTKFETLS